MSNTTNDTNAVAAVSIEVGPVLASHEGESLALALRPLDAVLGCYGESVRVRVAGHVYRVDQHSLIEAVRIAHFDRLRQSQIK
jgi:hypothetical protein